MSKSSCCGAELVRVAEVSKLSCQECKNLCDSIPSDIMSKKEIVEFYEKWQGARYNGNVEMVSDGKRFKHTSNFFYDLQQFLKSVKHHMGKK